MKISDLVFLTICNQFSERYPMFILNRECGDSNDTELTLVLVTSIYIHYCYGVETS